MAIADEDEDFRMALELQLQINEENEYHQSLQTCDQESTKTRAERSEVPYSSRRDLSVVDAFWELNDPNPDVHSLFIEFNEAFFFGKLSGVEVRWSPRMTLCAGLCCYEGKGGLCSVRLSEPLLKLRPRKDLVETLLHEMIHAYLFVTHNNKDHDAHGPEFHKHMERINKASGAHITVYHNFHGEVENYRTHWWRCNGPCQHRRPFFGIVKRAMNRPPSDKDIWWPDHQHACGGTFIKIREPEPKAPKSKRKDVLPNRNAVKKPKMADATDIRSLLVPQHNAKTAAASVPAMYIHQGARPKLSEPCGSSFPGIMKRLPSNVHTLSQPVAKSKADQVIVFSGIGRVLGGNSSISQIAEKGNTSSKDRSLLPVSSCVLGTSMRETQNLLVNKTRPDGSAKSRTGHLGNKHGTESPVKLTTTKSSRSSQPTLAELLGKKTPPTKLTSRRRSAAKMKFIRDLLSSDSESDGECVITKEDTTMRRQETCSEKITEQSMSISSSLHTSFNASTTANMRTDSEPVLVECPACGSFMEEEHINRHLDICLVPDD